MAKQQIITHAYTCDMTKVEIPEGQVEHRTLTTPNGTKVTLDLCPSEATVFDATVMDFEHASNVLAEYAKVGTKAPKANRPNTRTVAPRKPPASAPKSGPDPKDVRAWANANGHPLGVRGRVPASIIAEYEKVTGLR